MASEWATLHLRSGYLLCALSLHFYLGNTSCWYTCVLGMTSVSCLTKTEVMREMWEGFFFWEFPSGFWCYMKVQDLALSLSLCLKATDANTGLSELLPGSLQWLWLLLDSFRFLSQCCILVWWSETWWYKLGSETLIYSHVYFFLQDLIPNLYLFYCTPLFFLDTHWHLRACIQRNNSFLA